MKSGDNHMKRMSLAAAMGALGLLLISGAAQAQLYQYKLSLIHI